MHRDSESPSGRPQDGRPLDALPADEVLARWARDEAAADDGLRDLLVEVVGDLAVLEAQASADALPALSPHVRAAALDRYSIASSAAGASGVSEEAARTVRPAPLPRRAETMPRARLLSRLARPSVAVRIAALVLLTLGAFLLVSPAEEAQAGLRLTGMDRLSLAEGTSHLGAAQRLTVGSRVEPGPASRVALRFPGQGALLLDREARAEVVRMPQDATQVGLRLDAGRARIRSASRPVEVAIRDAGTLVVRMGEACARVEQDPGVDTPAVWLPAGGEATWMLKDGRTVSLLGPIHASLETDGVRAIEDAVPPCRELVFFGPARTARVDGRRVDARRWRVIDGGGHRRGPRLELSLPARVAWRPAGGVADARTLRVVVRSTSDLCVRIPALGLEAVTRPAPVSAEVGRRTILIPLPPGWHARLGEGELELAFARPESREPLAPGVADEITFEGATFLEEMDDER